MVTVRRSVALFALILTVSPLWAQVSHALPAMEYGPVVFTRGSKDVSTATDSFTPPQLVYGPFRLFVVAPGNDGVVVQLNGTTVFGAGAPVFPTASQPVTLLADNSLNITLPNTVGHSVVITIMGYQYEYTSAYQNLTPELVAPRPDDIDWRTKGAVTPVKNEGSCQSDWAFSATGAAEGFNQITTGTLMSLSEQELIDCMPRPVHNCAESNPAAALTYLAQNGDETESEYPYQGKVQACSAGSFTPTAAAFTSVTRIPAGDEASLQAAVNQHPVSVVINSNWFSTYTHGVADPDCSASPPTFTAVLIVGYTSQYWIVKTSLGTTWGNAGFFNIVRNKDACGIADFAINLSN